MLSRQRLPCFLVNASMFSRQHLPCFPPPMFPRQHLPCLLVKASHVPSSTHLMFPPRRTSCFLVNPPPVFPREHLPCFHVKTSRVFTSAPPVFSCQHLPCFHVNTSRVLVSTCGFSSAPPPLTPLPPPLPSSPCISRPPNCYSSFLSASTGDAAVKCACLSTRSLARPRREARSFYN